MINRKHKGAQAELTACAWLIGEGYEVFRNVSQHGDIDLVAIRGTETLRLDVKTVASNGGRPTLSSDQARAGVAALYVRADGKCSIERGAISRRAPCLCCGRPFRRTDVAQRYCSFKCEGDDASRRGPPKTCPPQQSVVLASETEDDRYVD